MTEEFEHEKELEKLDREEYWFIELFPFVISFLVIYFLYKSI